MESPKLQDYLRKYNRLINRQNGILYAGCFLVLTGVCGWFTTWLGWGFPNILSWFWTGFADMDNAGYWNGGLLVLIGISLVCYSLFNMESLRHQYQNHWLNKLFENSPSLEYGKEEIGRFFVQLWEAHIKPKPKHLIAFKGLKDRLNKQKQRVSQLSREEVWEEWDRLNKQLAKGVKQKWEDSRIREWWDKNLK